MERNNYFSIIIITLNEEKNISTILKNLKGQTYDKFEIIIVDSNSEDNTKEIALQYKNKFKEFTFLKMKKRGVSLGRNTGGKNAKYENLLFLDADTTLEKHFLKKLNKYINTNKNIHVGTFLIALNSEKFIYNLGNFLINIGNKMMSYIYPTCVGACIYSKKDAFDTIGGFEEHISLGEDSKFSISAKKKGYKFRIIPLKFTFHPRRFEQEGTFKILGKYLISGFYLLIGKQPDKKISYKFSHYKK